MSTKQKEIALGRALDLMRLPNRRLVQMHTNTPSGVNGVAHYIVPGGGPVALETAEKIKAHPGVTASKDGLFPGISQTWRFRFQAD
jgi:hypothetical protein